MKRHRSLALALSLLLTDAAARAQAPGPDPVPPLPEKAVEPPKLVELHGYVQPQFGVRHRPQTLLRDRWEYGGLSSRAGLIVSGTPVDRVSYVLHVSLDARTLLSVTGLDLVDTDGNGSIEGVAVNRTLTTGTLFEEATVGYGPVAGLTVKIGAMRVPFTVALRSLNTQLLFANRSGANEVFQSGSDQGALVLGEWLDGRIQASVGAFTGTSLGLLPVDTDARGLLYSARVDGNPLGRLPRAETDFERGGLRFGFGMGALYRDTTVFSKSGYELADLRDLRVSTSVRVAILGVFVQAEGFRRLATDNVGSRPARATGGYVQASFFIPLTDSIGVAPAARAGTTAEDELTFPRRTTFLEGGLAFFPRIDQPRPESVRFLFQYAGELRSPERDQAHALVVQAQVLF